MIAYFRVIIDKNTLIRRTNMEETNNNLSKGDQHD